MASSVAEFINFSSTFPDFFAHHKEAEPTNSNHRHNSRLCNKKRSNDFKQKKKARIYLLYYTINVTPTKTYLFVKEHGVKSNRMLS